MSYETRYAAAMRQRSDAAASTPAAAVARGKLADAMRRAKADTNALYPEACPEAFEYLNERIAHWRKVLEA